MKGFDVHNHWIPAEYIEFARSGEGGDEIQIVENNGREMVQFGGEVKEGKRVFHQVPLVPEYNDWDLRLAEWDKAKVDKAAVSVCPFLFHHNAPAEYAIKAHNLFNDALANAKKEHPDRILGLGSLPMQDVEASVTELKRLMTELDLDGIQIGSNVRGVALGDKRFRPVFKAAAELGAFVLIHPCDVAAIDRFGDYYLKNLIGNPLDTTISAATIIFSGLLDEFPGLNICLSHAGGLLPYVIGRFDHGWRERAECKHLEQPPTEYFKRFYFDIISHSERALQFLVDFVGPERIMIGTDYPFDMGVRTPVDFVNQAISNKEDAEKIINGNASALLLK